MVLYVCASCVARVTVLRGITFRARTYADGLEHPRLWGIAGTVSAPPGRGAKARRASSTMTAAVWANARK